MPRAELNLQLIHFSLACSFYPFHNQIQMSIRQHFCRLCDALFTCFFVHVLHTCYCEKASLFFVFHITHSFSLSFRENKFRVFRLLHTVKRCAKFNESRYYSHARTRMDAFWPESTVGSRRGAVLLPVCRDSFPRYPRFALVCMCVCAARARVGAREGTRNKKIERRTAEILFRLSCIRDAPLDLASVCVCMCAWNH